MTLKSLLGLSDNQLHSVIFFIGDCTFKTPMPQNVMNRGLIRYVKGITTPVLAENEVARVVDTIQQGRLAANWQTHRQHVAQLKARHGKAPPSLCQPACRALTTQHRQRPFIRRTSRAPCAPGVAAPWCCALPVEVTTRENRSGDAVNSPHAGDQSADEVDGKAERRRHKTKAANWPPLLFLQISGSLPSSARSAARAHPPAWQTRRW